MKTEEPKDVRNNEKSRSRESEIREGRIWLIDRYDGTGEKREEWTTRGEIWKNKNVLPIPQKPQGRHSYCTQKCNRPPISSPSLTPRLSTLSNSLVICLFIFYPLHLCLLPLALLLLPSTFLSSSLKPTSSFLSISHTIWKCSSLVAQTHFKCTSPPFAAACHSRCLSNMFILHLCLSFTSLLSISLPPELSLSRSCLSSDAALILASFPSYKCTPPMHACTQIHTRTHTLDRCTDVV